jgi:hypothetical protein
MKTTLSLSELEHLSGGDEVAKVACPLCGPSRKTAASRERKVMRIYDAALYLCSRCGANGGADNDSVSGDGPLSFRELRHMHRMRRREEERESRSKALQKAKKRYVSRLAGLISVDLYSSDDIKGDERIKMNQITHIVREDIDRLLVVLCTSTDDLDALCRVIEAVSWMSRFMSQHPIIGRRRTTCVQQAHRKE